MTAVLIVVAVIVIVALWRGAQPDQLLMAAFMLVISPVIAFVIARGVGRGWRGVRIGIDDDRIVRQGTDGSEVVITRAAITVVHQKREALWIGAKGAMIVIPSALESYDEVAAELKGWYESDTPAAERRKRDIRSYFVLALALAVIVVLWWSVNPYIVVPLGLLAAGRLIWVFIAVQRNPTASSRVRLASWVIIAGPVLFIVVKLLFVLLVKQ
jgi:hypothetical protein